MGRYVLDPAIFDALENLPPGRNGEIQLTDGLRVLNGHSPVYAYEPITKRYDVGEKLGYLKATVELALQREDIGRAFREYLASLSMKEELLVRG